jgi:hypothetical protein
VSASDKAQTSAEADAAAILADGKASSTPSRRSRRAPAPPVLAVAPTQEPGKLKAEAKLRAAEQKRREAIGLAPAEEKAPDPESLVETWDAPQMSRAAVDPDLAGLYKVIHGAVFFHAPGTSSERGKLAPPGATILLSAEDADMLLDREMVKWVAAAPKPKA